MVLTKYTRHNIWQMPHEYWKEIFCRLSATTKTYFVSNNIRFYLILSNIFSLFGFFFFLLLFYCYFNISRLLNQFSLLMVITEPEIRSFQFLKTRIRELVVRVINKIALWFKINRRDIVEADKTGNNQTTHFFH